MKLADALKSVHIMGVDTAPFIYYIEKHPTHFAVAEAFFEYVDDGVLDVYTSVLTLAEVLMKPIQAKNIRLQTEYRDLLLNTKNVSTIPVDNAVAIRWLNFERLTTSKHLMRFMLLLRLFRDVMPS